MVKMCTARDAEFWKFFNPWGFLGAMACIVTMAISIRLSAAFLLWTCLATGGSGPCYLAFAVCVVGFVASLWWMVVQGRGIVKARRVGEPRKRYGWTAPTLLALSLTLWVGPYIAIRFWDLAAGDRGGVQRVIDLQIREFKRGNIG